MKGQPKRKSFLGTLALAVAAAFGRGGGGDASPVTITPKVNNPMPLPAVTSKRIATGSPHRQWVGVAKARRAARKRRRILAKLPK